MYLYVSSWENLLFAWKRAVSTQQHYSHKKSQETNIKSPVRLMRAGGVGHSCRWNRLVSECIFHVSARGDSFLDLSTAHFRRSPNPICESAALSGFFQHSAMLNHRSHESRLTFKKAPQCVTGNNMLSENGNQFVWSPQHQKNRSYYW